MDPFVQITEAAREPSMQRFKHATRGSCGFAIGQEGIVLEQQSCKWMRLQVHAFSCRVVTRVSVFWFDLAVAILVL